MGRSMLNLVYYDEGYQAASTNIKMYYAVTSEMPSTIWLRKSKGDVLNTRSKIDAFGINSSNTH